MKLLLTGVSTFLAITFLSLSLSQAAEKKAAPSNSSKPLPSHTVRPQPQNTFKAVEHHAAQDSGMAVGLMLGEPSGASGKYWLDSETAVDGGIGYSFSSAFIFFADYLWHFDSTGLEQNDFTSQLKFYA